MLVPTMVAGVVGTFCVLSVNAWMNNPTGFRVVEGSAAVEVTDVDPWAAMFNDGVWLMFAHMWVGAYMLVGFVVAAVYAAGMLRGRRDRHHRMGFMVPFVLRHGGRTCPAAGGPRPRAASGRDPTGQSPRSSWPRPPSSRPRCGSAD